MRSLFGAAALTAGCMVFGLYSVRNKKECERNLFGLICGLEELRRGLTVGGDRLEFLFARAEQAAFGKGAMLFARMREALEKGKDFRPFWEAEALEGMAGTEERERESLRALGQVLGRYDRDSQLAALDRVIGELRDALERAELRRKDSTRVELTFSVSVGVILSLLLW